MTFIPPKLTNLSEIGLLKEQKEGVSKLFVKEYFPTGQSSHWYCSERTSPKSHDLKFKFKMSGFYLYNLKNN